jgi:hypothetical protein
VCPCVNASVTAERRVDGDETVAPDSALMAAPSFQVILIRAWSDRGGLRIRLLVDGDSSRQWVVGSIADARDVLSLLLAELLAPPTQPELSDLPASPRAPGGEGTARP